VKGFMRAADCDILMVPGLGNSEPEHWQTRWEGRLSTARRIEQSDWARPRREVWVGRIGEELAAAKRPVVLVAHSLGVHAAVAAAREASNPVLKGLFLVAPPGSRTILELEDVDHAFAHPSLEPLSIPSVLIASRSDPHCPLLEAEEWAHAWGADFVDAGDSGHLNVESGHGPWPEGLMRFAGFLSKL